jgi:hypothetical protein
MKTNIGFCLRRDEKAFISFLEEKEKLREHWTMQSGHYANKEAFA